MRLELNLNPEFSAEVLLCSMHNVLLDFCQGYSLFIFPASTIENRLNGKLPCPPANCDFYLHG